MGIKGSRNRDTNKPAWDECPLWGHIDARKKEQDINLDEHGVKCLSCMDTGIHRCSNPDHGFIAALSFTDMGRLGCPCCDGTGKMAVDEVCYDCDHRWKAKNTRIFNDNKHLIKGSNVKITKGNENE